MMVETEWQVVKVETVPIRQKEKIALQMPVGAETEAMAVLADMVAMVEVVQ